jgi:ribosomal protein L11 methyltransferase
VIRLAVRVRNDRAEVVLAELLELAPAGVEELQIAEDTIEYAVYGAPGELPTMPALQAAVGDALVEISTSEIADDWQERWKRFHRPVMIEAPRQEDGSAGRLPGLRVRPPWEPASDARSDSVQEIVIDPGQAFGTGAHATTRLCLELLLALAVAERASCPLLDVGTGSGVLAIAAAKLGFAPVLALDDDRASVAAARENAVANDVEIDVRRFDLRLEPLPRLAYNHGDTQLPEWVFPRTAYNHGDTQLPEWVFPRTADNRRDTDAAYNHGDTAPSDAGFPGGGPSERAFPRAPYNHGATKGPERVVVVANLLRPLLLKLSRTMTRAPAHIIAGGLLVEQTDEIVTAFADRLGLRERERRGSGEWGAVWLVAP